jgi:ketosteroid isomerase-like protein
VPVTKPEDMNAAFAEAVNSGEIERLLALYEPDALLAPRPGERARGEPEIGQALSDLLALEGRMTSTNIYCMQVDDLALLQGDWRFSATAPDGTPIELAGRSAEVVRRQGDGSWRYVIDHPFGSDG